MTNNGPITADKADDDAVRAMKGYASAALDELFAYTQEPRGWQGLKPAERIAFMQAVGPVWAAMIAAAASEYAVAMASGSVERTLSLAQKELVMEQKEAATYERLDAELRARAA
jgi:hypothetical protein